jgi:hypothetical protein
MYPSTVQDCHLNKAFGNLPQLTDTTSKPFFLETRCIRNSPSQRYEKNAGLSNAPRVRVGDQAKERPKKKSEKKRIEDMQRKN